MANIKSRIKRSKQYSVAHLRKPHYRGSARTYIRKAQTAINGKNTELAEAEVQKAIRALDKAAQKGVIHKNNAARRKSRLMARFNAIAE